MKSGKYGGTKMTTTKHAFTLRLSDEVFVKTRNLAKAEHRSVTNYIEHILLGHIQKCESIQAEGDSMKAGI